MLAKLLARLYDPTAGCILAGGLDLRGLSLADWHDAVGCVFQDTGQYEATVADNIAYGDWQHPSGDHKEIVQIARLSGVHDMIEAMPQGYDTSLGRTVVLISHRFSAVSIADRILVLDGGRIIEQGAHQDLLAQKGHYASLYCLHVRHMSGET